MSTRVGDDVPEARVQGLARLTLSVLDGLALNHTLGGRDAQARAVLAELGQALATAAR
jgi:hypothetical protein